ncbi:dihydrodipicolinate synthetase [Roseivivax marinus]|uniref:Dihydrodipicolinate synthetase n=1 Tax=Roseivivax marinus TaxID=1379903 RepID=W4HHW5_9RHOB|nr:dihydrodipicolinate synthase family protein [Roseivivax marinus]ETW11585.1 dihydrodipicolinate synthetase [Roseivivax marinus]
MSDKIRGVLSPVVTPFDADLQPDTTRWLSHCRWLLSQECGLAIFGTNSEANSLSVAERRMLLETAADAGLDTDRMMPGTGACALPEAVELTRAAVEAGAAGVLMLPPFYYKGVSDDGLFAHFSEVIERVGDARLRLYLYHIPPVAQVPVSLDLIERLLDAYPGTIAGIKDSSGDWSNTKAMLDRFENFDVFPGSEEFLLEGLRHGAAGCISATANVNPGAIHALFETWTAGDADERQAELTRFRKAVAQYPMIPALKAIIGLSTDDPDWGRTRPPLVPLDETQRANLAETLKEFDFTMPGRTAA